MIKRPIKSLVKAAGQIVSTALTVSVDRHSRVPGKIVLVIQAERLCRIFLIKGCHLTQGGCLCRRQCAASCRHAAAGLPVIHAVNLGAAQPQQFSQAIGRVPQAAEITFIDHARPVGDDDCAAVLRKCAKFFRKSIGQQVEHRHHDQTITCQVGVLVNKLHSNALPCKGIIVPLQLIPIAHTGIARAAGAFQRPLILPIMDYGSLLFAFYRCNFGQSLQP